MKKFCGLVAALLYYIVCYTTPALAEIQTVYQLDDDTTLNQISSSADSVGFSAVDEEYRLDAGDKIKVSVFGEPDMTVEMRLGSSGDMRYPFLGKIHVAGMTLPELQKKLTRDLANGYLIDPQVRVSMEEFRPFYVSGEVKNPGGYPYQPGLTVRKAISLAGGFSENADENKIFLIYAADELKRESKAILGQKMRPNDILTVKQSFFFVNGEVKKPGKYPYKQGMTYRMAISMAGGLAEKSNDDKVHVVHEGNDRKTYHVDNLDAGIRPDDVITAKEGFF